MKPIGTIYFHGADAHRQVEKWAEVNGYVIAPMQRDGPRGMMPAALYDGVAKWRNLTPREQAECHAVATFTYLPETGETTGAKIEQFKPSLSGPGPSFSEAASGFKDNVFHQHLDVCERCRTQPFNLCVTGQLAMARVAADIGGV